MRSFPDGVCHHVRMGAGGRVVVVGQGYVGLPLAMRAAEVGYDVVGFDVDGARIARLAAGDSYVGDIPDRLGWRRRSPVVATGPTADAGRRSPASTSR